MLDRAYEMAREIYSITQAGTLIASALIWFLVERCIRPAIERAMEERK